MREDELAQCRLFANASRLRLPAVGGVGICYGIARRCKQATDRDFFLCRGKPSDLEMRASCLTKKAGEHCSPAASVIEMTWVLRPAGR